MGLEMPCDGQGVGAVPLHPQGKGFQVHPQEIAVHGAGDGSQIPHQLGRGFGDVGQLAEFFRVGDAVVGFVRGGEAGEFVGVSLPVKIAAVHNAASHLHGVAVHVLGGGVGDNVGAPGKGTAVYGGGKGVVHDQGHTVAVGRLGKTLNVQNHQGRVGDGLGEDQLGVGAECGVQLLVVGVGADEGAVDAHFL